MNISKKQLNKLYSARWILNNRPHEKRYLHEVISLLSGVLDEYSSRNLVKSAPSNTPKKDDLRLAILVGHTQKDGGAYSKYMKMNEYTYNSRVASRARMYAVAKKGIAVKVFYRDGHGITGASNAINKWVGKNGCVVELHFNAFNGSASGSEALYDTREPFNKAFSEFMSARMAKLFKISDRGGKKRDSGRGAHNLKLIKEKGTLLEAGFGDNKKDSAAMLKNIDAYAKLLVLSALDFKNER